MPIKPSDNPKPFVKGQSGNPNGRPKGLRNRSTVIREFFEASMKGKNPITGKDEELTVEQRVILSMLNQAINKGNTQAVNFLYDSLYGKIQDKLDVTSDQETLSNISKEELTLAIRNLRKLQDKP